MKSAIIINANRPPRRREMGGVVKIDNKAITGRKTTSQYQL